MNKEVNGFVLTASLASIATAIFLYARGNKEAGIFVGLWAPTFLGLATVYNGYQAAENSTSVMQS